MLIPLFLPEATQSMHNHLSHLDCAVLVCLQHPQRTFVSDPLQEARISTLQLTFVNKLSISKKLHINYYLIKD